MFSPKSFCMKAMRPGSENLYLKFWAECCALHLEKFKYPSPLHRFKEVILVAGKISTEEAARYLSDVDPARVFYVHDGRVLKNLYEFSACLKDLGAGDFEHHVNTERNDFYNWVTEIVQDQRLAKDIKGAKTSSTMMKKVDARLKELKKAAGVF
jgi:hypothetical protein